MRLPPRLERPRPQQRPEAHLAVALTVALLAGACGSGGGGSPAPIPMDGYVQAVINRNCARNVACGQTPDMATCVASSWLDLGQLFAAVSAGKTTYDGAAAAKCFAATSLVSVACTRSAHETTPTDPSCAQIFNGTLPEGAACSEADDCLSANCNTTTCSGTPPCCTGTCAAAAGAPLPIGGDCTAAGSSCVAGAYCQSPSALCVAYVAAGQPCNVNNDEICAAGLTCAPDATLTQQLCAVLPAEGESCVGTECNVLGDFCSTTTEICVPKIAVGGVCGPTGAGCVDYAYCDPGSQTCLARGKAGEACDVNDYSCLGALQCTPAGICALPAPAATCP